MLQLVGQARLTSMDRCCHLVVEEGDLTLYMWHKHVGEIIVSWRKQRNRLEASSPDQLLMVICCRDMKTTNMVGLMVELGEKATFLNSRQDMSESRSIFSRWCDAQATPLVVRDTALPSLAMVGADKGTVLIHWDLPTNSKTTFTLHTSLPMSCLTQVHS